MKVLHVITGLRTGGAENQLALLARHTRADVEVVALTNADEVAEVLRADGVPVTDLGMRSNKDLAAVWRLARLLRRARPDVVHVHLYRATLYGRLAAWLARVPVVVTTEHSLLDGSIEGRPVTPAVRALYLATERFNHATVAVSDDVAQRLLDWGVRADRLHVVPNGVDFAVLQGSDADRARVRAELGVPPGAEVVGGLGRLHHSKSWDLLLRALAPDLGAGRRLVVIGDGDQAQPL
ncbi:MAG: glycosyltransferase, partial [Nocardioidaceae bacterium]|nr:glycosyltransferase [Nocardioidaceae bacterium]